jgi:hypothetical protein
VEQNLAFCGALRQYYDYPADFFNEALRSIGAYCYPRLCILLEFYEGHDSL